MPNRAGIVGRRCQRLGGLVFRRLSGDFAHGLMKGQAEDLDKEVDGVAGKLPLRAAPVAVFDQQARIGGQFEVIRRAVPPIGAGAVAAVAPGALCERRGFGRETIEVGGWG